MDAFLVKFGETPLHMLTRFKGMKFGEPGYEDELPADFVRRGGDLFEQYIDTIQRVGAVPMCNEEKAIKRMLRALRVVLRSARVARLDESIERTPAHQVTFAWFQKEVHMQWARQEHGREDLLMAKGIVEALP